MLVDAATNEKIDNIEWSYTKYNNKFIINVLNYDWENDKTVKIMYRDKEANGFTELISGASYGNTFTVTPYEPVLIQYDIPANISVNTVDESGNVLEYSITDFQEGDVLSLCTDLEGMHILALYHNDKLISTSVDGTLKIPALSDGTYRVMAAVWGKGNLMPVSNAENIYN